MAWFQLKIEHCPTENIEKVSEELEEAGSLSIMLTDKNDNPVLEPAPGTTPLWPEVIIHCLFDQLSDAQRVSEQLRQTHPGLVCHIEILEDKDWERAWMDDFKPQQFGERLWICPTWHTPPDPHAVNLMLDPGLAFGTGTHPTTSLCLKWLEQANLKDMSVIDYGCGSGILSLAALKLGAQQLYAVDIDNQALQATQSNATLNCIDLKKLAISHPEEINSPVDIIIANILLGPLISLKDRFHQLLHPTGLLIVSGILNEQVESLMNAYDPTFKAVESQSLDEWSLVVFSPH